MDAMTTMQAALYGSPPSVGYRPSRDGVLNAFSQLLQSIGTIVGGVASTTPATYAALNTLNGHLEFADRSLGIVYNDGDNTGLYIKSGASGTGSWTFTGLFGRGVQGSIGPIGPDGKSFYDIAVSTGYVPVGTSQADFVKTVAGQIAAQATAAAVAARDASQASATLSDRRALASAASASTAAAADQSVRDNIAKVDTASALQLQAVSRQALAAIGPSQRSEGRQAYLGEQPFDGNVRFLTGDQSARVAADPDKALTYPPADAPTGTSGVWARPVTRRQYDLRWWLGSGSSWTNCTAPLTRALALIEPYSDLIMPVGTVYLSNDGTVPGTVISTQPGMRLRGHGRDSAVVWQGPVGNGGNGTTMFLFRANDVRLEDFRISGMKTTVSQGGANGVIWTKTALDEIGASTEPLRGFKAIGMFFDDISHPIVTLGSTLPGSPSAPIIACQDVEIAGCQMEADYYCYVPFFSDNVRVHGNHFKMLPGSTAREFKAVCRMLGSKGVTFTGNVCEGDGTGGSAAMGIFAATAKSESDKRRQNADVTVTGNSFRNVAIGLEVAECRGAFNATGNSFINPISNISQNYAARVRPTGGASGVQAVVDQANISDNIFRGFMMQGYMTGVIGEFDFSNNKCVSNSTPDTQVSFFFNRGEWGGNTIGNVSNNRVYDKRQDAGIRFGQTLSGDYFTVDGNILGETPNAGVPSRLVSIGGAGKLKTSITGPELQNSDNDAGNNARSATGTWQQLADLETQ